MIEFPAARHVNTNGIRLAVYEAGSGPPVVLLHGYPELAFSWRHQLPALAEAGYRAVAPDLRGYGGSSKPQDVGAYRQEAIFDDIAGLLADLGEEQAVFVAHDWGALIAWQMALLRPELMRGLVALNIPFLPRPGRDPVEVMRERLGDNFYIVNFQDSDAADKLFGSNPKRYIELTMRKGGITRKQFDALPPERQVIDMIATMQNDVERGEPLLSDEELGVYATAFAKGGFRGPINWYRNWSANWRETEGVTQSVNIPVLFLGAENDFVVSPKQIDAMHDHVTDLEVYVFENCGHWMQQEKPQETNALMLDWLERRFPVAGRDQ